MNTYDFPRIRYSGPFFKWTREELQQMDQQTRGHMTMHRALLIRDDIDRLCVSRNKSGRGFASIEDCIDTSIRGLEDYKKRARKTDYNDQKTKKQTNNI